MKSCFIFCLFLATFLIPSNVFAKLERTRPLEFGVFEMSPFYIVENKKVVGGICTEIMEKVLKKAKLSYVTKVYPASRLYSNLVKGKTDIFIGVKEVPLYKDHVLFGHTPVASAQLSIYTFNEGPSIKSKDDLKGKSIITIRGFSYGGLIEFVQDPKNSIRVETANNHENGIKMLINKRADYLLEYSSTLNELLLLSPLPNLKSHILSDIPLYIIVSKAHPKAQELMALLSKAWEEVKKETNASPLWHPQATKEVYNLPISWPTSFYMKDDFMYELKFDNNFKEEGRREILNPPKFSILYTCPRCTIIKEKN